MNFDRVKRVISLLLSMVLVLGYVPATAFAAEELCEHHQEHIGCSYVPAVEAAACTHQCGDECYTAVENCIHVHEDCGTEENPCDHACSSETGCVTSQLNCAHTHGDCGYAEGAEEVPCDFVCAACEEAEEEPEVPETTEAVEPTETTEPEVVCICESDEPDWHAPFCALFVMPENPACYCVEKCTAETVNEWCEVCYFDLEACGGEDEAAPFAGASGTCGDNLTWELTEEGTLTISGTGAMNDYSDNDRPWQDYMAQICSVVIESGVTSIGKYAFYNCSDLNSVTIPDSVQKIGPYAFNSCISLGSIQIPDSVTRIENGTFNGCSSLSYVALGSGITYIGSLAFQNCDALTEVNLPFGVTEIDSNAFAYCNNLETVTIPDSVTIIRISAFDFCTKLHTVTLPSGLKEIKHYTFRNCSALTEITIPASVTTIWQHAFEDCSNLSNITFAGKAPEIYENAFSNVTANAKYPENFGWTEAARQNYGGSLTWESYDNGSVGEEDPAILASGTCGSGLTWELTAEGTMTISGTGEMGKYSMECLPWQDYLSRITKVVIEDGVTDICDSAFSDCFNLTTVSIPDSVLEIGSNAFSRCINLGAIQIPGSVNRIGRSAFYACTRLTSVTLGSGIEYIDIAAFHSCAALTEITFPGSVTTIEESAFYYCSGLKTITFQGNAPEINNNAFTNVTADAWYPLGFDWTAADCQNYGGKLTWNPTASAQEEMPAAEFTATGYDTGVLTKVTAGMQYSLDQGETWTTVTADTAELTDLEPLSEYYDSASRIWVKMPGNGTTTADSEIQKINVYRESAPSNVAAYGYYTITGVTSSMEYRKEGAEQWTKVPQNTMSLSGLEAGVYEIRTAAAGKYLASDAAKVTVEGIPVYKITYELYGGTINGEYATEYTYGEGAQLPADVTRDLYSFRGWSDSDQVFNEVTEIGTDASGDKTFYAWWQVAPYTITWTINGEFYAETAAAHMDHITAPDYLVPLGYTFSGWDIPDMMPAESITLDATLTAETFKVTFTVNGEEYRELSFLFGTAVTAPDYTAPEGYIFSGWDVPETMPAEDIELDATLTAAKYKVTWTVDGEKTEEEYAYGETVIAPADPSKAGNRCVSYSFKMWDGFTEGMTMPATDLEFIAVFDVTEKHIDRNRDHICDRKCGKTDVGQHTDSATDKDHFCDYGCKAVIEACSDKTGDRNHNCDICRKKNVTAHTYAEATCTKPATCTECGAKYGRVAGHKWDGGKVTKEATCTRDGVKTYSCGSCDATRTEKIKATGHDYKNGICENCDQKAPGHSNKPHKPNKPNKPHKPIWGWVPGWCK